MDNIYIYMEIYIGKYKMRVEILVVIVILFWVMFGHILCSCCKVSLFEGLKGLKGLKGMSSRLRDLARSMDISSLRQERDKAKRNYDDALKDLSKATSGPDRDYRRRVQMDALDKLKVWEDELARRGA
jgi:hypothetical protein